MQINCLFAAERIIARKLWSPSASDFIQFLDFHSGNEKSSNSASFPRNLVCEAVRWQLSHVFCNSVIYFPSKKNARKKKRPLFSGCFTSSNKFRSVGPCSFLSTQVFLSSPKQASTYREQSLRTKYFAADTFKRFNSNFS